MKSTTTCKVPLRVRRAIASGAGGGHDRRAQMEQGTVRLIREGDPTACPSQGFGGRVGRRVIQCAGGGGYQSRGGHRRELAGGALRVRRSEGVVDWWGGVVGCGRVAALGLGSRAQGLLTSWAGC